MDLNLPILFLNRDTRARECRDVATNEQARNRDRKSEKRTRKSKVKWRERNVRFAFGIRGASLDYKLTRESSVFYASVSCVSSNVSLSKPFQTSQSSTKCVTRCSNDKTSGHAPFVHLQARIAYRLRNKTRMTKGIVPFILNRIYLKIREQKERINAHEISYVLLFLY